MTTNRTGKERFLELDYLRGLAAVSVILFHYTYGYDNGLRHFEPGRFYFRYGNLGVQLFFMISGFVIFMTLERTKTSMDFLVSRFSRLYPTYWAAILLTIAFCSLVPAPFDYGHYTLTEVLVNFTMLQHWLKIKDINAAFWTLAVELTFYFLMWVLFCFKKLRTIEVLSVAWLALSLLHQVVSIPFGNILQQVFILPFAPMFVAGVVYYNAWKRGFTPYRIGLLVASYGVESVILYNTTGSVIPIVVVAVFFLVFFLLVKGILVIGPNRVLQFLGCTSYSVYVIHETIGETIIYNIKKVIDSAIVYVPVTMAIVFVAAWLVMVYIEQPAITLIRNFYKKRKQPAGNPNLAAR
ncbi:acyltransferase [Puia sp.]|jgi:peptidoglycan/LPS O-acetylase OafA/YrhL|uniref:acyltransferase family protein n=1 Tax=Puia sp. TaxID=2045100 RepID=UPI002F42C33E